MDLLLLIDIGRLAHPCNDGRCIVDVNRWRLTGTRLATGHGALCHRKRHGSQGTEDGVGALSRRTGPRTTRVAEDCSTEGTEDICG